MANNNAAVIVAEVLADSLPPGVPPSHLKIIAASFLRLGRQPVIEAELEMFDGLAASVQCCKYGGIWSHYWVKLDGGSAAWNGEAWERKPL